LAKRAAHVRLNVTENQRIKSRQNLRNGLRDSVRSMLMTYWKLGLGVVQCVWMPELSISCLWLHLLSNFKYLSNTDVLTRRQRHTDMWTDWRARFPYIRSIFNLFFFTERSKTDVMVSTDQPVSTSITKNFFPTNMTWCRNIIGLSYDAYCENPLPPTPEVKVDEHRAKTRVSVKLKLKSSLALP
jgi:hypothetical protein